MANEPQVTKRKVVLSRPLPQWDEATQGWVVLGGPGDTVTDFVPDDTRDGVNVLQKYVEDAKTRWGLVEVGDLDAGPGGYHGQTYIPHTLDHPLAGTVFPATPESER